ncbi:MAG: extracellular solute-binding protein [Vallitaleaceae bacterium]|nr:extracellular solute-binding protein [Vallitaleaceae bacterium]
MLDLSDLEATSNNLYAKGYAVDGKVVGVPDQATREYVFYWKDIFADFNIEVPTTWDEFIAVANTIKDNSELIPIVMGGKDSWPDYPFNEYMPALEAQDGFIWNTMASMDSPFDADQPYSIAYHKLQNLYDEQVMGIDPLGLGFDQAKVMFAQQEGAMMATGVWAYADIASAAGDNSSNIGAFLLPTRDSKDDDFVTISQADVFLSISENCENADAAKDFINWFYSELWYPAYIQSAGFVPTVEGVEGSYEQLFIDALAAQPDVKIVVYDGGGADFNSIVTETKFDVKVLGQEMMTTGFDLDAKLSELNDIWAKARESLGIQ